jgi:uncharacterized damage-inducible protein DinB
MLAELETACQVLEALHSEILSAVGEFSPDELNWIPPVPDANSIFAIATHTAASQLWWIRENLAGQPVERDRPAEFKARGADISALQAAFAGVQAQTRAILGKLELEHLAETRQVRGKSYSVRWIVYHVIEHTATHLGHIQLTRQWLQQAGPKRGQ